MLRCLRIADSSEEPDVEGCGRQQDGHGERLRLAIPPLVANRQPRRERENESDESLMASFMTGPENDIYRPLRRFLQPPACSAGDACFSLASRGARLASGWSARLRLPAP